MIMPHPIGVVNAYLEAGFTVCYVDANELRRNTVKALHCVYPSEMLAVGAPVISGKGSPHYNILVTVNEQDFDPIVRKELVGIPGVSNGLGPMIIRISL